MRFEIPALIVVDADSAAEARKKAGELTRNAGKEEGIGVAPIGLGRECEADRTEETISAHVRSILAASPISYISP